MTSILSSLTFGGTPITPQASLIAFGAVLTLRYIAKTINFKRKGKLPPGPPGLPVFGNVFQLSMNAWTKFTEWKKIYGPVVYINVAGQSLVIINTHKAAADLLDRRAGIYSDRPRWIVASDILSGSLFSSFTPYGDLWRRMRRASHEGLNKTVALSFQPVQTKEAILLTHGILVVPQDWLNEFRRVAASTVLTVVYGLPTFSSCHDPAIARVNDFTARLARAAFPGAHFVEYFTWMKVLPASIAKWKRDAMEWFRKDSLLFEGMFTDVEKRVSSGDETPSFAASLIRDQGRNQLSNQESAWLSATMYAAGAETTAGVLSWFMLAMVKYPEVQKHAHAELDSVVGRSRMPTFADREHLPYICAMVREALRWHPVGPFGIPHRSIQDDWYEGHFIPKHTIVIANIWALNRDPEVYGADVEEFNPGRFIAADGKLAPAIPDSKEEGVYTLFFFLLTLITQVMLLIICVGRHVATSSLFIDIACLLWAASIEPVKDVQGKPVIPDSEDCINDGLVVRPVPFEAHIAPRFPDASLIVSQTKELYDE